MSDHKALIYELQQAQKRVFDLTFEEGRATGDRYTELTGPDGLVWTARKRARELRDEILELIQQEFGMGVQQLSRLLWD